jgi:hypothetical protein
MSTEEVKIPNGTTLRMGEVRMKKTLQDDKIVHTKEHSMVLVGKITVFNKGHETVLVELKDQETGLTVEIPEEIFNKLFEE